MVVFILYVGSLLGLSLLNLAILSTSLATVYIHAVKTESYLLKVSMQIGPCIGTTLSGFLRWGDLRLTTIGTLCTLGGTKIFFRFHFPS